MYNYVCICPLGRENTSPGFLDLWISISGSLDVSPPSTPRPPPIPIAPPPPHPLLFPLRACLRLFVSVCVCSPPTACPIFVSVCVCLCLSTPPPPLRVCLCLFVPVFVCLCICVCLRVRERVCARVLSLAPGRNSKVYGGGGTRPQAVKYVICETVNLQNPRILDVPPYCRDPRAVPANPAISADF